MNNGAGISIDETLTEPGCAADAKVVGDKLKEKATIAEVTKKADKTDLDVYAKTIDVVKKADKSEVDKKANLTDLDKKADKTDVEAKANKTDLDTKADLTDLASYAKIVDLDPYLKSSVANDTFLAKANASTNYLTKTDANNTYAKKADIPTIPKGVAVSDATEETVLVQVNALLVSLRNAGLIAK